MTPADRRALVGVAYVFAAITAAGVLLALLTAGCTGYNPPPLPVPPLVIWHRSAPLDWTKPDQYAACTIRGEKVLEDGTPNGRRSIRLDCAEGVIRYLDLKTKRLIWTGGYGS